MGNDQVTDRGATEVYCGSATRFRTGARGLGTARKHKNQAGRSRANCGRAGVIVRLAPRRSGTPRGKVLVRAVMKHPSWRNRTYNRTWQKDLQFCPISVQLQNRRTGWESNTTAKQTNPVANGCLFRWSSCPLLDHRDAPSASKAPFRFERPLEQLQSSSLTV